MISKSDAFENKLDFDKSILKLAVIGHNEWINFLEVDNLPEPGIISHAKRSMELPAGGGSVIAKTLLELNKGEVHFFTSLGDDYHGKQSYEILQNMGLTLHVAWRNKPTRKGFSLIDSKKERSITIIGERLEPRFDDFLEWGILAEMDGIFITAGDQELFTLARKSKILCSTPRVGINVINNSEVFIDGLVGSNLDPGEAYELSDLNIKPKYIIKTEGENGGVIIPGGRFSALKNRSRIDSYGCGDSFAAGILYGLASEWSIEKVLTLGKVLGRNCLEHFGPYPDLKAINP